MTIIFRAKGAFLTMVVLLAQTAGGAEFFAAPNGTADGDGSQQRPWNLTTALSHPEAVRPGDTVWLRGGTYRGGFVSRLTGREGAPIIVRQFPGERATIDTLAPADQSRTFYVKGDWSVFWGFEVLCSDPRRTTKLTGSWPSDINRGGIDCRSSHVKFINLVVHDLGGAFGFWSEGEGGEIYGCLIYNNGWKGPDRGHGHGVYAQNQRGVKRLADNVLFNQFGDGIHCYGSEKAALKGFHLEGNVALNNGVPSGDQTAGIRVGGATPAENITIVNNFTYAGSSLFGYAWGSTNRDLLVRGNFFHGQVKFFFWDQVTFTENTVLGTSLIDLEFLKDSNTNGYRWNDNTYARTETRWPAFVMRESDKSRNMTFQQWREETGLDRASQYREGAARGVQVFVRPNQYEPGRAHVIVYNWDRKETLPVDLSGVLESGATYTIVSAQDYFAEPIVEGVYRGKPIALPMTPGKAVRPVGMTQFQPPVTGPEFGVFVVKSNK